MIKLLGYLFFIIVFAESLIGCGFAPHNANTRSLPPELKQVYYQAEKTYGPLEVKFKKKMKSCGVTLLSEPIKSAPIINLTSSYSHSTYTTISSAEARTYTLNYTATISITDFYHQTLLTPQVVTVTRGIALQPNEVFDITPQITTAKREMLEELINKIFDILGSQHTATVLKPKPHEN